MDIIQKCVILSATLADLYGGASIMSNSNRDISIQPFATSSILQHHYQSGAGSAASGSDFARRNQLIQGQSSNNGSGNFDNLSTTAVAETAITTPMATSEGGAIASMSNVCNNNSSPDNGSGIGNSAKIRLNEGDSQNDNGVTSSHKSPTTTNEAIVNQSFGQVS